VKQTAYHKDEETAGVIIISKVFSKRRCVNAKRKG